MGALGLGSEVVAPGPRGAAQPPVAPVTGKSRSAVFPSWNTAAHDPSATGLGPSVTGLGPSATGLGPSVTGCPTPCSAGSYPPDPVTSAFSSDSSDCSRKLGGNGGSPNSARSASGTALQS